MARDRADYLQDDTHSTVRLAWWYNFEVTRYIRRGLAILLLVPLYLIFTKIGLRFEIAAWILFVVIPLAGLLLKKNWFYYYVYIVISITVPAAVSIMWLLGLFGDQAYSALAIIAILWPVLLYFVIVLILTVILHRTTMGAEVSPHQN
ncbi:MAG: hypothetical protein WA655_15060 [Candidatus Korobacteraceae bacterium]